VKIFAWGREIKREKKNFSPGVQKVPPNPAREGFDPRVKRR